MGLTHKIAGIPVLWNIYQDLLGANQWKLRIYPSVFKKPGVILDFGCSSGNITSAFLDFEYYGVDVDCQAIANAKKKFSDHENVHFFCKDILTEDFKRDFFDYVLFAGTGHHIPEKEIVLIIDKLMGTLKPEGELHFFDIIRQPGKDKLITRFFTMIDQGKYVRTIKQYEKIFDRKKYNVVEVSIFESPDKFLKLQDFLYLKIAAEATSHIE